MLPQTLMEVKKRTEVEANFFQDQFYMTLKREINFYNQLVQNN